MSINVSEVSDASEVSEVSEVSAERIWGVPKNAWLALAMLATVFVGNRYNVAPLAWVVIRVAIDRRQPGTRRALRHEQTAHFHPHHAVGHGGAQGMEARPLYPIRCSGQERPRLGPEFGSRRNRIPAVIAAAPLA